MDKLSIKDQFSNNYNVSRETISRLEVYHDLLMRWQKIKNLVSRNTLDKIWSRHFADSAQLIDYAASQSNWLDIGTGAGFPGMVIAIMTSDRSNGYSILVDSDHKKCAFLREVARETGARVEIRCGRIERMMKDLPHIDIVTARALAPMTQLIDYCLPILETGAAGLFLKGRDVERELKDINQSGNFYIELNQSRTEQNGRIVKVQSKAYTAL